jgi:small-conductance mechanosensitive channel
MIESALKSLSWEQGLISGLILVAAFVSAQVINRILGKLFSDAGRILKVRSENYRFFRHMVSAGIYFMAIILVFYMVPSLRALSVTLFAGAGIFAAIIGFASQQAFSNIVAGIFIVIFKPFRVGDYVHVGNNYKGYVSDITLRHTVLHTFENSDIIIPNSTVSSDTVINFSYNDDRVCRFVEIQISFGSDLDKALQVLQEECQNHPLCIDGRTPAEKAAGEPIVPVRVTAIGPYGVHLKAWAWAATVENSWYLGFDLNRNLKLRFDKEGIVIPYPHQTLHFIGPDSPVASAQSGATYQQGGRINEPGE